MKVIINGKETDIEIPDNMKLKGNEKIEKIDGKWCKVKYSITEEEIIKKLKGYLNGDTIYDTELDFTIKCLLDLYKKEKQKNAELEDIDLTTVYMSGFYDGEQKWKNNIKNKIKELKKIKEKKQNYYTDFTLIYKIEEEIGNQIEILEEVLQEK